MTTIRVERNGNYTTMSNIHLQDKKLSLQAKGLMSQMLSLRDDWDYSVSGLATINEVGRTTIRTVLKELEVKGYLVREQKRIEEGKFGKISYTLHEKPLNSGFQPKTEYPHTDRPQADVSPQSITKELITNTNKKDKVFGLSAKEPKTEYTEEFESFWKLYPKKNGKGKAFIAFKKNIKTIETLNKMIEDLEKRKVDVSWTKDKGQFIPHPSTYLNSRDYDEEFTPKIEKVNKAHEEVKSDFANIPFN